MKRYSLFGPLLLLIPGLVCSATAQEVSSTEKGAPLQFDWRTQIPTVRPSTNAKAGLTIATAGDLIYSLPMLPRNDPGVEAIAAIVRSADAAITNQEGSIIDLEHFGGYLEAQNGGGYPVGKPALADDIAGLGFDFAVKANNHAADFGNAGLLESKRHLEEAGVLAPGAGTSRSRARAAALLDTPHGRLAVVSTASTFPESAPAGEGEGSSWDRPGISVVRTRRIVLAPAAQMAQLRVLARSLGSNVSDDATDVVIGEQAYRQAEKAGVTYEMNPVDRFEILRTVRGSKNVADATVFTIHAHENAGMGDDRVPADFQQVLYHDVIDAGGDVVFVHGPHITRGIEIYKGRPIFYGLGHFAFQMLGMAPRMRESFEAEGQDPRFVGTGDSDMEEIDDAEYQGVVAVTEFGEGGVVSEIRLYPIDMRHDEPLAGRGIPKLATGTKASQILRQVQSDSRAYGTQIAIVKGVGLIKP